MKRHAQRDLSVLNSRSSNEVDPPTRAYRKLFVEEWISALPEHKTMHRVKKLAKTAKATTTTMEITVKPEDFEEVETSKIASKTPTKSTKTTTTTSNHRNCEEIETDEKSAKQRNLEQMVFASVLYGTDVECLDPEMEVSHNSHDSHEAGLSESLLNLTLESKNVNLMKDVMSIDSDSSWESTDSIEEREIYSLVEYPPDVAVWGKQFKDNSLETINRHDDSPFEILVFDVVPPLRFWFIHDKVREMLSAKLHEMNRVYDSMEDEELKMAYTHVFPRQICAVPFNVGWARGIVCSYLMGSKVSIFLVDFGMEVTISPKALKYLKNEFLDYPRLAMRGILACVKQKAKTPWIPAAKKLFHKLMGWKSHTARIVEIKNAGGKNIYHLQIIKRSSGLDVAEFLVDNGLVEYKEKYAGIVNQKGNNFF